MSCAGPTRFQVDELRVDRNCIPPPRYTAEEWKFSTLLTTEAAEAERQVAEHLHSEAVRVREEANELARRAHDDVEHRFRERLADVQHWRDELTLKFGEINDEIEAEMMYRRRLEIAVGALRHILDIDAEIITLRNYRVGVDLVHDEPQKALIQEIKVVEGVLEVLQRTQELCTEQIRLLRKTTFSLDKELKDKDKALEVDRYAQGLNVHRSEVTLHCDLYLEDCSIQDETDWKEYTAKNKLTAQKAINNSIQLRMNIDSLLRQASEDIQKQVCDFNRALANRIKELIEVKEKLQAQHSDISVNIREMETVVCQMNLAYEEMKSAVALAETRLKIRCQRPNMESVKDAVQRGLILEVQRLHEAMAKLNIKVLQSKNALRNLLRNQLELEDAINVKMNSIGIDEAKVMVLRNSIHIPPEF